jgi:hypothetical protein
MKATKKIWLAIISSAALIVAVPGLASAGGTPSGPHRSYAPSPSSSHHALPIAHPSRVFRTHPLVGGTRFSTIASNNWSGFAAFGDHFRFITVTYSIPSLNCAISPDGSFDSEWAGLDGFTTKTVEQIGTFAFCSGGTPSYFAFLEMAPSPAVSFMGVSPGDSVTASVFFSNSTWRLELVDNTTQGVITQTLPCPSGSTCRNASAEVISEVPNGGPPAASLADYGIVGFPQIGITDSAAHRFNFFSPDWSNDKIFEVNSSNGDLMQAPSKLEGSESGTGGGWGNQAFTDTAIAPN